MSLQFVSFFLSKLKHCWLILRIKLHLGDHKSLLKNGFNPIWVQYRLKPILVIIAFPYSYNCYVLNESKIKDYFPTFVQKYFSIRNSKLGQEKGYKGFTIG